VAFFGKWAYPNEAALSTNFNGETQWFLQVCSTTGGVGQCPVSPNGPSEIESDSTFPNAQMFPSSCTQPSRPSRDRSTARSSHAHSSPTPVVILAMCASLVLPPPFFGEPYSAARRRFRQARSPEDGSAVPWCGDPAGPSCSIPKRATWPRRAGGEAKREGRGSRRERVVASGPFILCGRMATVVLSNGLGVFPAAEPPFLVPRAGCGMTQGRLPRMLDILHVCRPW